MNHKYISNIIFVILCFVIVGVGAFIYFGSESEVKDDSIMMASMQSNKNLKEENIKIKENTEKLLLQQKDAQSKYDNKREAISYNHMFKYEVEDKFYEMLIAMNTNNSNEIEKMITSNIKYDNGKLVDGNSKVEFENKKDNYYIIKKIYISQSIGRMCTFTCEVGNYNTLSSSKHREVVFEFKEDMRLKLHSIREN